MDNGASSYHRFLCEGDDTGLCEIIVEYRNGLTFYLSGIVGDITAAEELAEDTFVVLATKKPKYRGISSFKTWIYTIGRNLAFNYLKKRARHSHDSIDEHAELTDGKNEVESLLLASERDKALYREMKKLKPEYRQVIHLIYFDGFTNKQTALIMKKSVHSIETLVYRARNQLRKQLEKEGFIYENL